MNDEITTSELAQLLASEAKRINNKAFISTDPVQFPRRFSVLSDIEITSLLVSTISWGNRTMICRNAERLLAMMDYSPTQWMRDGAYELIEDRVNIHRTFFGENLKHFMRGLRLIYKRYDSLDAFAKAKRVGENDEPAYELAHYINGVIAEANNGQTDSRCLPHNLNTTPLKRLNMALRWLVRDDGIVDMGVWRSLRPSQLLIPLDVHVANTSRQLGLIKRKSADRKALRELMDKIRPYNPDDPALFDYALFGIGMGL